MSKRIYLPLVAVLVCIAATSCIHPDVYNEYQGIPEEGWLQDSAARFDVEVADTLTRSDILINIRHTGEYPYQNLWLFVHSTSPSGRIQSDTIACYLADNRGRWLGTRYPSIFEMPVLYMEGIRFPEKGSYHFDIYQAMRDSSLTGIRDIGLQVCKQGKEEKD